MEEDKMTINISSVFAEKPNLYLVYKARINDIQSCSANNPSSKLIIQGVSTFKQDYLNTTECQWIKYTNNKDDI